MSRTVITAELGGPPDMLSPGPSVEVTAGLRRRLLQDSAWLASGQVAALATAAATGLLAARWLGPQGRGQLVLALAVASFLAPLAAGGIDSFIASRAGLDPDLHERPVARLGLRIARWGGAAVAATTLAYGFAVGLPLEVVALAAAVGWVRPTLAVLQAMTTSRDDVVWLGRVLALSALSQLCIVLALSAGGASVGDFITASLFAHVIACLLLVRRNQGPEAGCPAPLEASGRRRLFRFSGTVVLGDAVQTANYRLDVFLLAAFVPLAEVGIYAVAVALVEVLWQLPQAVSRSIFPRIKAGQLDRSRVVRLSGALALGLGILSAAGLALASWITVPLLGPDYARVPGILAVLLPGVVFVGISKPLAAWTLSQGRPRQNLTASAIGLVVMVVGDLWLIPRFGLHGAAVASTLAYVVTGSAVVFMLRTKRSIRSSGSGGPPQSSDEDCVELLDP